ncbi:MAG: CocE/NonD family hydrolase [Chthonomonadaceae bacterium]|nr:CocE/NonD family hydrolase [Chthonomonadaceae bacterium]
MFRKLLALTVFWPTLSQAQSQTFDVYYSGSKCGESTGSMRPDGTIVSHLEIKIGPVTVTSDLTGRVTGGALSELDMTTTQSGQTVKVTWKNGKYTIVSGGKETAKDKAYSPGVKPALAVFHPVINSLLWKGTGGNAKKTKLIFVDNLAELEATITANVQSVKGATVNIWSLDLGPTQIELAFDPDGTPLGVNVPSQKINWVLRGRDGLFVDSLAKYPELSQPTYPVVQETRVRMKTRDGVSLMADIARPNQPGKYPTILIRTPYGRAASIIQESWYAKRGYVVVSQDVRGRGGSDGEWDPLVNERRDGKDTLDWIVSQPWSDGKVGMIGGSYLGYVQWAAATTGHPALKCIVPQVSPPQPDKNFPWENGSFMLMANLWWCRVVKDRSATVAGAFAEMTNLMSLNTLPLTQADNKFFGSNVDFFDRWLRRPNLADWGDVFTTSEVAKVKIPALHVSGIWDGDGIGTALHWEARNNPRDMLVFGPWTHLFNSSHKFGDIEYGANGILELEPIYLRFFDTYLKDKSVSLDNQPKVRMFVTGKNSWAETSSWPPTTSSKVKWNLSAGKLFGSLSGEPGSGKTSYDYNPLKPAWKSDRMEINVTGETTVVPLAGHGRTAAIFKTSPFKVDTALSGPTELTLYVSSTAKDATFSAMVLDEGPDGVSRFIGLPGISRTTYLNGAFVPRKANQVVKLSVQPWWFAHDFKAGHRLVLHLSSDAFPRFARNPGTGSPDASATKLLRAKHTIWSTAKYPSSLSLHKL